MDDAAAPQADAGAVPVTAAGEVGLPDGRTALVLRHPPCEGRSALALGPLRTALGGSDAAVVLLVPDGTDAATLLAAATACGPSTPVLATPRPVVDAIKRVDGDRLAATVDRGDLRWVATPAVLDRSHLVGLITAADAPVQPLAGQVRWLDGPPT